MALDSCIPAGMTAFSVWRGLCITTSAGAWEPVQFSEVARMERSVMREIRGSDCPGLRKLRPGYDWLSQYAKPSLPKSFANFSNAFKPSAWPISLAMQ